MIGEGDLYPKQTRLIELYTYFADVWGAYINNLVVEHVSKGELSKQVD